MSTTGQMSVAGLATVGLSKSFGGVRAVDDATVEFHHGEINALIGPNGSGKTTFFNCVTGMIRPDAGAVSYRGRPITGTAPHRVAAAGIGRSFQLCRIFPRMTVLENVLAAARPRGIAALLASAGGAAEIKHDPTGKGTVWKQRAISSRIESSGDSAITANQETCGPGSDQVGTWSSRGPQSDGGWRCRQPPLSRHG